MIKIRNVCPKINRMCLWLGLAILVVSMSACSTLDKARTATDLAVSHKKNINLQALLQAETERQRLRALRCHSSFLSPSAISGAALHPKLGRAWVDELLRDCPEFAAFVAELVLQRAENAAMRPLEERGETSK